MNLVSRAVTGAPHMGSRHMSKVKQSRIMCRKEIIVEIAHTSTFQPRPVLLQHKRTLWIRLAGKGNHYTVEVVRITLREHVHGHEEDTTVRTRIKYEQEKLILSTRIKEDAEVAFAKYLLMRALDNDQT